MLSRGLLNGITSTTFQPNDPITKEMLAVALGRLGNVDVTNYNQSSFTDVKADHSNLGYIEWASKNNIITGSANDTFEPNQPLTREQVARIMQNYVKALGIILLKVYGEITFADKDKISANAKDAIKEMQMAGIMIQKNSNQFDPLSYATRGEVSTLLRRYMEVTILNSSMQGWQTMMQANGCITLMANQLLVTKILMGCPLCLISMD